MELVAARELAAIARAPNKAARIEVGSILSPPGGESGASGASKGASLILRPVAEPGALQALFEARLTPDEQRVIDELKARDREVRDHEQAHARVGGPYAGEPSYSYQIGPDGKRYAVGGEVSIDVTPVPDDPEATIAKMDVVKAAALAPAEPSSQDRRVAALADAQRLAAMADLAELRRIERQGDTRETGISLRV
ncbi:MAG: putative metalloprotease CJM1_0395 family protein [Pseudomonadota bacterium]